MREKKEREFRQALSQEGKESMLFQGRGKESGGKK